MLFNLLKKLFIQFILIIYKYNLKTAKFLRSRTTIGNPQIDPRRLDLVRKYVENIKEYEENMKEYDKICRKYERIRRNMWKYVGNMTVCADSEMENSFQISTNGKSLPNQQVLQ